ncbi:MAG: hypothetical protein K0T99_03730 [Alphaproteobacteria bacterium]|nr:hypothetical protein [Alphaproteobacteria bacterium]
MSTAALLNQTIALAERDLNLTKLESLHSNTTKQELQKKEIDLALAKLAFFNLTAPEKLSTQFKILKEQETALYEIRENDILASLYSSPTKILHDYVVPTLRAYAILCHSGEIHPNAAYTGSFVLKRIPNLYESSVNVLYKSGVEAFLSENILSASNPTVTSFVRDITKITAAATSYYYGYQVGGTKYYFDEFLLLGSIVKPLCKTAFIAGLSGYMGVSYAARSSNYICETPSRLLTKIHREYQDTFSREDIEKHSIWDQVSFLKEKLTYSAVIESLVAAIIKTITTDLLGEFLGKLTTRIDQVDGNDKKIHIVVDFFTTQIPSFNSLPKNLQKFVEQSIKNAFATYALTPPARIVEDLPGLFMKTDLYKFIYEVASLYGGEFMKQIYILMGYTEEELALAYLNLDLDADKLSAKEQELNEREDSLQQQELLPEELEEENYDEEWDYEEDSIPEESSPTGAQKGHDPHEL